MIDIDDMRALAAACLNCERAADFASIMGLRATPRRFWVGLLLCLLAGLPCPCVAAAAERNLLVSQYQHTAWLAKDGAPIGVHAVAQTDDGFLWLGSEDGLFRFDGQTFERIDTPGGTVAGKSYVYALVAQPGGRLWVGFRRGDGVGFLKDGQFTRLPSTIKQNVKFMSADRNGTLWVQFDYGLFKIQDMKVEAIDASWNAPLRQVGLAVDRTDSVWVATADSRLFRLTLGSTRFVQYTDDFSADQIAVDPDGGVWGTGRFGTWNVIVKSGLSPEVRKSVQANSFGTMLFDRAGGLWLQRGRGLSRQSDPTTALDDRLNQQGASAVMTAEQGLSSETIFAIFEDRDGNIWTGTSKGLDRFRKTALTPVKLPGRALSFIMAPAGGSAVWAANWPGALMKVTDGEIQHFPAVGPGIKLLRHDAKGGIWVGGGTGLWHSSDGSRFEKIAVDPAFIVDSLRAIEADGKGGYWISGGSAKLAHVVDGRWMETAPAAGFPARGSPFCLVKDRQKRIWACYGADPFSIIDGKAVKLSSMAPGLDIGTVISIRPHGDRIWFGGYTGIAVFDGRRVVNLRRRDGSSFGEVGGIVELPGGDVWLHNRTAALRIPATEVESVLAGARDAVDVESLDEADGLYGTLSASSPLPSLIQGDDGRLWFATDAGLAWLDPSHRDKSIPAPPVQIRSLTADGRPYDLRAAPLLAPRNRRVELTYSATSLSMPERVRFRYRLDGVDADWQDAGLRRTAYFNDLRPGQYAFRVKSTDSYGRWNDDEARVDFRVEAAWFQTAWFKSLAVAVVLLAVWSLHRGRARFLLRAAEARHRIQMQTRIAERDRIARELHDTVLQGTIGLVLNMQVAIDRIDLSEPERRGLEALLARAEGSVEEARSRVTGLRTGMEPVRSFVASLREICDDLAGRIEIHFEFPAAVSGEWDFDPQVREQLVLIVREAVGNACQHARASRILVRLTLRQHDRVIEVIDDGVGFTLPDVTSIQQARSHWGLQGMRERAGEIGARFHVRSELGAGTDITLVVPAHGLQIRWKTRETIVRWLGRLDLGRVKPAGAGFNVDRFADPARGGNADNGEASS